MSNSNRNGGIALVVLVASLTAIVLTCWIENKSEYLASGAEQTTQDHNAQNRGPSEGYWWPEFAARDTYAQWATAFLTFVSTVVSIWAVRLVRDQLILNRDATKAAIEAVTVAREAAGAGRAWLLFSDWMPLYVIDTTVGGVTIKNGIGFRVVLKNFGNSPAIRVRASIIHRLVDVDDNTPVIANVDDPFEQDFGGVVSQQTSVSANDVFVNDEDTVLVLTFRKIVEISCVVTYCDVFNPEIVRSTRFTHRYIYQGPMQNSDGSPGNRFIVMPYDKNIAT